MHARAQRASLPGTNDYDLNSLVAMPPYWGWVEHRAEQAAQAMHLFLGGNDDGIALRLFWNGHYERHTLALWSRLARGKALALDVGAHTGIYTLAAFAAEPAIDVLSFEPGTMNYARLTLNLRANGHATSRAHRLGVSDRTGVRPFTLRTHEDFHSSGGTFESVDDGHVEEVAVVALDAFLPRGVKDAVGLIKLDVEGHEASAFAGMRDLIRRARPTIVFECLHETTVRAVRDLLSPLGYLFFAIDDMAGTTRETLNPTPALDADGNPILNQLNCVGAVRAEDLAIIRAA